MEKGRRSPSGETEDEGWSSPTPEKEQLEQEAAESSELVSFRKKWKEELSVSRSPNSPDKYRSPGFHGDKDQEAKELYLKGIASERAGESYLAMLYYRQATKLVPEVERLCNFSDVPTIKDSEDGGVDSECHFDSQLLQSFKNMNIHVATSCEPQYPPKGTHISCLPNDVIRHVVLWLVSDELDLKSLEQLSMVCRGYYMVARDQDVWRRVCRVLWKDSLTNCSAQSPWRQVYLETPHPHFYGCYISKASYVRVGEQSLDNFYKPFHLVEYYRYIRFFADGLVMYMTAPEEPQVCLSKLKAKQVKSSTSVLCGHYRMNGSHVSVVVKSYRFEPVGGAPNKSKKHSKLEVSHEVNFHMEFQLKGSFFRKLSWVQYTITTLHRQSGQVEVNELELDSKMTPFFFSPVKSYTVISHKPLP